MTHWETHHFTVEPWRLRKAPGVYAWYVDGKLIYVGQSWDLATRVRRHGVNSARYSNRIETPWGMADRVTLKVRYSRRLGDWQMWEARLIYRLRPLGNQKGLRPCRAA